MKMIFFILMTVFYAQAQTVDEILDRAEKKEKTKSSKSIVEQIVVSPDGRESVSSLISYSKDEGDKGLMIYQKPARIKDMKILTLNEGDDIWFFSPRTGRVRKIASHNRKQSVNGSDFSYEDLSTKDQREDYHCSLSAIEKRNENDCFKIEMKEKEKGEIYSKIIAWIDTSMYIIREMEFYDENGNIWKKLYSKEIKKIKEYYVAAFMEMKDLQKDSYTIMKLDSIEMDILLDDDLFSERNLKR